MRSAALSDDPKSVVVEVSKAVGAALDELHFPVEALGDAVVFGEAPHAADLLSPTRQRLGQGDHGSQATILEFLDQTKKPRHQRPTLTLALSLLTHEHPHLLHLLVDWSEGRAFSKEFIPSFSLLISEPIRPFPQGGQITTAMLDGR